MIDIGPLQRPIRLLVVDIDGCLVPIEHAAYDLVALAEVAALNARSRDDAHVPPLTILSGRPHPYVDALMQLLDIEVPAIFENGAGMAFRSPYHARYRHEVEDGREALDTLRRELSGREDLTLQPGKSASLTVFPTESSPGGVGGGSAHLEKVVAEIKERNELDLLIDPAHECVNILVPGVDKGLGLRWLAEEAGVDPAEVAGIGDSGGDLAWLSQCGVAFAPANADAKVRSRVRLVSAHEDVAAVLELYQAVIEANQALARADGAERKAGSGR